MNGNTMLAGAALPSGRAILLLTALPLGDHTFAVGAKDNVGNVSPTQSVTFSIVVTPESLIQNLYRAFINEVRAQTRYAGFAYNLPS